MEKSENTQKEILKSETKIIDENNQKDQNENNTLYKKDNTKPIQEEIKERHKTNLEKLNEKLQTKQEEETKIIKVKSDHLIKVDGKIIDLNTIPRRLWRKYRYNSEPVFEEKEIKTASVTV